ALALRRVRLAGADADDVREETDARRVHVEVANDGVREVTRLDRLAVRVLQPLAQGELVGLSAVRDRADGRRQTRHDLRAVAGEAAGVRLVDEAQVRVLEDLPRLEPVGE